MKELITIQQANTLMWAALIVIPLLGLAIGRSIRQTKVGLLWGLAIGIGNIALWRVYNAITDRLGLDTVKNLLVNLGIFIGLGVIIGLIFGIATRSKASSGSAAN